MFKAKSSRIGSGFCSFSLGRKIVFSDFVLVPQSCGAFERLGRPGQPGQENSSLQMNAVEGHRNLIGLVKHPDLMLSVT